MVKEYKLWENEMPLYEADKPCENKLTAYLHEDDMVRPAVVIYPGGAYALYGETEQHPIARFYYDHGYNAFICYYRIAPYHHPAPLMDAQRAVKLVRYRAEEWHIDPERVFTIGFSAGGHLNGCVATLPDVCTVLGDAVDGMDARPTGAILSYAVISAEEHTHAGSFMNLLGERCEELCHSLSLEYCVGKDTCPCFVWHTISDTCVSVKNSILFTEALIAQGIDCELHLFPKGDHGWGLAEPFPGTCQWPLLSLDWLNRQG
ncbi:MAG: alpha/beta hydrolase [Clostridia bacterium]|nr:alpha/beta hydrolase [Clostridia bacterium]